MELEIKLEEQIKVNEEQVDLELRNRKVAKREGDVKSAESMT